ncbi:MAG: hypothetical protein HQL01_02405 [Nitrospirae bacterium]|nr:hypothetical protein [Nitrospirota bacterium]
MNDSIINKQRQQIEYLLNTPPAANYDDKMLSHWAKYVCVLTSGYIENAISHYISEFSRKKAHPYITNYVTNSLDDFMNPKMEKILKLIGSFDKKWKEDIEDYVEKEGRKDAIDSIVANRNQIAHGEYVGLSLAPMINYYKKASEVLEFIKIQIQKQMSKD